MKSCRILPDNRLDWRDPDMPVLRIISYDKGRTFKLGPCNPKEVQSYYQQKVNSPYYSPPSWREDETYNMRRKKK